MPEIKNANAVAPGSHTLTLNGRERLTLTGVSDVPSFCEQTIVAETSEGCVTILGEGLHISRLHLGEGVVSIEGRVTALEYGETREKRGLTKRLFR